MTTQPFSKAFANAANDIAFDKKHRQTINFNISRYDAAVAKGEARYNNLEVARNRAAAIKRDVLAHWDSYLLQFEENATKNGVKVLWAKDTAQATEYIKKILKEKKAKLVVKSKSMTTEEIAFNEIAEDMGCRSIETDLGEFIVQEAGERPYHIVTPAMHKSKKDIAELFHQKFNTPFDSTPEELTHYVREKIREDFTKAEVGVTGANFLVADVGGISVTENEGNALMSTAFPDTHVVIAGMEKLIPRFTDLALFYPLLASHGTGQQITVYNTLFTAPKKSNEADGPSEMIVILLDNGRTKIYQDHVAYEALSCIRCGACLNGCPVYKTIGGYTYESTYTGPIGSVLTPFFKGFKDFSHLSFASSLCGKCVEVCPVRIPLTNILLHNRMLTVKQGLRPKMEKIAMKGFEKMASSRTTFDMFPGQLKNIGLAPFNYFGWGNRRKMPIFAPKTFTRLYKKQQKDK